MVDIVVCRKIVNRSTCIHKDSVTEFESNSNLQLCFGDREMKTIVHPATMMRLDAKPLGCKRDIFRMLILVCDGPCMTMLGIIIVVLQRSTQEAMLPYAEARQGLVFFSALLLIFVALTSSHVSATIARPLRDLADAARRMISGNYGSAVDVNSDDEFGQLATSFYAMRIAISDREERISHQALHDSLTDLPNRNRIM